MNKFYLGLLISGAALVGGISAAQAVDPVVAANGIMNVTAKIALNCTVGAGDLDFGTIGSSNSEVNSTVSVACNAPTPLSLTVGDGSHVTDATRGVSNGTDTIKYHIYTNSDYSGEIPVSASAASVPAKIYGKLLAADASGKTAGTYTDVVTLTLTY